MGKILHDQIKQNITRTILMAIMILFMVYPVIKATAPMPNKGDMVKLDYEWNVTVNDKVYENLTLSEEYFGMCNRGDHVTYECKLPEGRQVPNAVLRFYSVHSTVQVFVDDRVIYSFGLPDYKEGKLIGYGIHLIALPEQYAGKKLRIELNITEDNAFDGQQAPYIVNSRTYVQNELSSKRYNLAITLFLIVFGVITMCLSLFLFGKAKNFGQTFCIAMFSFLIGCWTMCNNDLIFFFTDNLKIKVYMEFLTFYFCPIPFTYYFRDRIRDSKTPKFIKYYFWILLAFEIVFFVITGLLQIANLVHLPKALVFVHLIMVVALIFIIILSIVDSKINKKNRNSVTIGFGIAVLASVFELIRFNIGKFLIGFTDNTFSSTLCIAILIIVISLLVDFGQSVSNNLYKDAEQRVLFQMAYMDELTGLANRRRCEELLSKYQKSEITYSVISLDMNFLKKINDTLGHDMGDAMLKRFADTLTEVFSPHGTVGRMGGDEFIVIMPDVTAKETEKLLGELEKNMKDKTQKDSSIPLSSAYGFAMSYEADISRDVHAAYSLADDRMYAHKRKSRLGRVD